MSYRAMYAYANDDWRISVKALEPLPAKEGAEKLM